MAATTPNHPSQSYERQERSQICTSQPEGGFVLAIDAPGAVETFRHEESPATERDVISNSAAEAKKLDRAVYRSWTIDVASESPAATAQTATVRPNPRWSDTLSAVTPFLTDYRRLFGGCSTNCHGGVDRDHLHRYRGIVILTRRLKERTLPSVLRVFCAQTPMIAS